MIGEDTPDGTSETRFIEHVHSRCNPGRELLAPFPAGKNAHNKITWITEAVRML
jgi:hypothetical protein